MCRRRCAAFTRSMTLHQILVRTTVRRWSAIFGRGLGCGRPARAATRSGVRDRHQRLGFVPDYRFDGRSWTVRRQAFGTWAWHLCTGCGPRPGSPWPGRPKPPWARRSPACGHGDGAGPSDGQSEHRQAQGSRTSPFSRRFPRPPRLADLPGGRRRTRATYAPRRGTAEQSAARRPRGGRRRAATTACEAITTHGHRREVTRGLPTARSDELRPGCALAEGQDGQSRVCGLERVGRGHGPRS